MRLRYTLFLFSFITLFAMRGAAQCVATITPTVSGAQHCSGSADTLKASTAAGNTYQWLRSTSIGGPYTMITGATSPSLAVTQTGTSGIYNSYFYYKVAIMNGSCLATSSADSIIYYPAPAPVITSSGPDTLCPGQSVTLSGNSGNQLVYQWTSSAMGSFNTVAIAVNTTGTYWLTEVNNYGCAATSSPVYVLMQSAPIPNIVVPSNPMTICDSPTTVLTTPNMGASYTWTVLTGSNYIPISGATSNSYTASANGSYELIAAYTNGCVVTSPPITTLFSTTPPKPTVSSNGPICLGSPLSLTTTNASASYSYSWTGPNGFSSTQQSFTTFVNTPADSGNYIVTANNNGCSNKDTINVVVTCIDSVWPGDANADHIVNNSDILTLGLGYGYTGASRGANADTITWKAQFCRDWAGNVVPGVNMKHADCNGDSIINYNDTTAISVNYDSTHARGIHLPLAKTSGLPDLYFDVSNYPHFHPGQGVSIPIKLGDAGLPVNNIMGIAAEIKINGLAFASPPFLTYPNSWLGNSTNTLRFSKVTSSNTLAWAYVRIDHNNISGDGTIANINFIVPDNIGINSWTLLYFDNVTIIDKNGIPYTGYNVVDDTVLANPAAISNMATTNEMVTVAPNPSPLGAQAYLQTNLTQETILSVSITDIAGRQLWVHTETVEGLQHIALPNDLGPGMYVIHVQRASDKYQQTLKWIKE